MCLVVDMPQSSKEFELYQFFYCKTLFCTAAHMLVGKELWADDAMYIY